MELVINSCETLEHATDFYHDAMLYINKTSFDREKQKLSLIIERVRWDETKIHFNLIFFRICSAPRIKSMLLFEQVHSVKLHCIDTQLAANGEPIDFINTIQYNHAEKKFEIRCVNGSEIELFVAQLNCRFLDIPYSSGKTRFISLFGVKIGGQ